MKKIALCVLFGLASLCTAAQNVISNLAPKKDKLEVKHFLHNRDDFESGGGFGGNAVTSVPKYAAREEDLLNLEEAVRRSNGIHPLDEPHSKDHQASTQPVINIPNYKREAVFSLERGHGIILSDRRRGELQPDNVFRDLSDYYGVNSSGIFDGFQLRAYHTTFESPMMIESLPRFRGPD